MVQKPRRTLTVDAYVTRRPVQVREGSDGGVVSALDVHIVQCAADPPATDKADLVQLVLVAEVVYANLRRESQQDPDERSEDRLPLT